MSEPGLARVLLVIATLGQRPEYLEQTIASIKDQLIPVDLVLVAPIGNQHVQDLAATMEIPLLPDPGSLPEAINAGAAALKPQHDYINWLNDDDLLDPNNIHKVVAALDNNPKASVAFGHCRYIDTQGQELWVSRTGKLAPLVLPWGPDLIPQPGMLVRVSDWKKVEGVDPSYSLAFDLDLLLKLKKVGLLIAVPEIVSSFRWHPDSLTVDDRTRNLVESERAKRSALPQAVRALTPLWDYPMRVAIRFAAKRVTKKAQKKAMHST